MRRIIFRAAFAAAVLLAGVPEIGAAGRPSPSGTVSISAKHMSFIFGAQGGGGTLHFQGRRYNFRMGGLGIGGFGISKIDAFGEVYHLVNASDFFGTYVSGRVGWAAGEAGRGEMWLKNTKGVYLHLKARRRGLMLSMGADTIQISRP